MPDTSFEERTEAPTPRRIQQARHDGRVVISRELSSALAMAAAYMVFCAAAPAGVAGLVRFMSEAMRTAASAFVVTSAVKHGLVFAGLTSAVPLGTLWVVACVVGVAQTRGLVSSARLRPDVRRISPAFARFFGRARVAEVGMGVLGHCVLLSVASLAIQPALASMAGLSGASPGRILRASGVLGGRLAIQVTLGTLALGVADYVWQHHRHWKALRMRRDEVKREHKEIEGDPTHKAERFRLHHEFMNEPSVAEVTSADFVVLRSGIVAAAVRYDRASSRAPIVILRGEFGRARAIEAGAHLAGVPVVVNPRLGCALACVDEGSEIPVALYEQVAECLVRVRATDQGGH